MPNHKSSYKRIRQTEKRNQYNRANKAMLKKAIRSVIDQDSHEEAKKNLPAAYSVIDKVTAHCVIHKNTAARKKARLSAHVKRLQSA